MDGDVVLSFCTSDPHGFPCPLPSNAQSPNPRGTHGQSRPELCPCPPGSPAGQSLGVPLQAEKGDTAWLSHQHHCGPKRRRALATSTCHSHISPAGPGCLISLHSWGAKAQRGKATLLQAHREWERVPGGWGRAGAPESGEPGFVTQLLCDRESEPLLPHPFRAR